MMVGWSLEGAKSESEGFWVVLLASGGQVDFEGIQGCVHGAWLRVGSKTRRKRLRETGANPPLAGLRESGTRGERVVAPLGLSLNAASQRMLIDQGFQQQPLSLPPAWDDDLALKALLRRLLPAPVYAELDVELKGFQERLAGRKALLPGSTKERADPETPAIHKLALLADGPEAEPTLVQHDQWGQRVDVLQTSEGWRGLKGVAAEEGWVVTRLDLWFELTAASFA